MTLTTTALLLGALIAVAALSALPALFFAYDRWMDEGGSAWSFIVGLTQAWAVYSIGRGIQKQNPGEIALMCALTIAANFFHVERGMNGRFSLSLKRVETP